MCCALKLQENWVWMDSDLGVAIGARVRVTPSGQQVLVDDEGKVNTKAETRGKMKVSTCKTTL